MEEDNPLDREGGGMQSRVTCGVHAKGDTEVSLRYGGDARVDRSFPWRGLALLYLHGELTLLNIQ